MNYRLLGIITGFTVALLILVIYKLIKKECVKKQYDERQLAIRGNCYKYAFWTLGALVALYACLLSFNSEIVLFLGPVGLGTIFFIAMGVFIVSAIVNDAYEAINDNKNWPVSIALIGLSNIVIGAVNIMSVGFVENGSLSFVCLNFECGVLLFFTLLAYKIKQKMDKSEE